MDDLRTFIVVTISSLMAYFSPINGILYSVSVAFVLNFIFGYIAGMRVNDESFDFKKAFACVKEVAVFFLVIASIYSIGEHLNNAREALTSVSIITYVALYFYATNVFKNLSRLFPRTEWIAFCYWIISFEFMKRIPFLESYLNRKNNGRH